MTHILIFGFCEDMKSFQVKSLKSKLSHESLILKSKSRLCPCRYTWNFKIALRAFEKCSQAKNSICTMFIFATSLSTVDLVGCEAGPHSLSSQWNSTVHKLSFPHRTYKIQTGENECFTCLSFVNYGCFVLCLFWGYFIFLVNWITVCIQWSKWWKIPWGQVLVWGGFSVWSVPGFMCGYHVFGRL